MKQPYNCWLKVLGRVGWDRKESPESNLHVCGKDDTKTAVYNVEKCTREGAGTILFRRRPYETNYLSYGENRFLMILVLNRLGTLNLITFLDLKSVV